MHLLFVLASQLLQFLQQSGVVLLSKTVVVQDLHALLLLQLVDFLRRKKERAAWTRPSAIDQTDGFVDVLIELDFFAQRFVLVLQIDAQKCFRFELAFERGDLLLQVAVEVQERLTKKS